MKGIFLYFILAVSCMTAYGQQQELSIGMGSLSHPMFKYGNFTPKLSDGADKMHHLNPIFISYNHRLIHNLDVGLAAIYESQKHDKTSIIPDMQGLHHIYREYFLTFLAHAHYHWLQKGILDLYSGAGGGICFNQKKDSRNDFRNVKNNRFQTGFAYQLTPLGLRIGKRPGGFIELGYGYKGLIAAGFSYRF